MDFENLVNLSTDYLSEYLWAFIETLRNPALRFQPLLSSKGNELTIASPSEPRVKDSGPYLNPKLLSFVLISIFIGSTINVLVPGRKVGPEIETTILSVVGIWFIYGSFIHLACKLLQGKGNYIQTMSVCLQIFAVLHVVSSFAALIFASIDAYFLIQVVLMAVYLPMGVKNIHGFGWLRQIMIVMLPIFFIMIIGLNLYQDYGIVFAPPPDVTVVKPSSNSVPVLTVSNSTIRVGAFNLQVFGYTKASKPEEMDVLSKTIRNFDIVAVQEIRDASQTALPMLKDAVNSNGVQYDFIVSERLGRTTVKEQYAYLYNTQTIQPIGSPYTYPDTSDIFEREPYISEFKAKNGNFDFVLITIYTDPDTATQEINDLTKVVDDARSKYQHEGDFMVLGDLNADCSYFNESSQSPLRSIDYYWVINNSVDTTTKSTNCTYDRIIITAPAKTDFTGEAGVFRFDTAYNLSYNSTIAVSDHYPVYASFWNKRDTD